jgi:cellulose synthase/poly-beta-1,6-N-acetylglucosamine synthase-like glycosyltransferase
MRLARYGYRTGVVDSTTWEEAPVGGRQWIGQRTRWMKGWLRLVKLRAFLSIFNVLSSSARAKKSVSQRGRNILSIGPVVSNQPLFKQQHIAPVYGGSQ